MASAPSCSCFSSAKFVIILLCLWSVSSSPSPSLSPWSSPSPSPSPSPSLSPWSSPSPSPSPSANPDYLRVPVDDFVTTLKSAIEKVGKVTSLMSNFTDGVSRKYPINGGLSDCLDFLEGSAEELGWSLQAALDPNETNMGTGDTSSDLRTWLSSVLINSDTCLEALDDVINGGRDKKAMIKTLLEKRLKEIATSICDALAMVRPISSSPDRKPKIPTWLRVRGEELVGATKETADAVVAPDGSGNFSSIYEAVIAAPERSWVPFIIYVKEGIYNEYVVIGKNKWNIVLIGDGMDATIIRGSRNNADGFKTLNSGTFSVRGRGFIGKEMTFENTAGAKKHQAVAFFSGADYTLLYRCGVRGYQDSLYAQQGRHFYKQCVIEGTVDFICGRSTAVFQDCQIIARKGMDGQKNTITAQSRSDSYEYSGFSIQLCNISAWPDVVASSVQTYLGRPWRPYSTTVVMQSEISGAISPAGWLEWSGDDAVDKLYYGEYMNQGPGADVSNRVRWPGYHVITDRAVAEEFTVANLIAGNAWLPSSRIDYKPGL